MSNARNGLLVLAVLALMAPGCAKQPPQEVADANAALAAATAACAEEYAASELGAAKDQVEAVNALAEEKKYKKAKKLAPDAIEVAAAAEAAAREKMAAAKADAEAAMKEAQAALDRAEGAEASRYASQAYATAKARLDEAQRMASSSDCNYLKVRELAQQAAKLAADAEAEAIAEKKRQEEEARRAEEERLRRLEEERRAREAAARMPAEYTVVRGDSLWRIAEMADHYADPFQWPLIYKANRSQIKDPDLIYPKQTFKIPRGMSQEEIDAAVHEARNRVWPVPNYLHDGK